MSEQEKKSGKEALPLVVVEQSTESRHKQYRPTDEQPELHPKRSRAPAVLSVAEELKDAAAKNMDSKERRESEHAITTEKHKHSVAKKLSSSTKRRDHSPEAITLAPIEVEAPIQQERVSVPSAQPVSPAVVVPSTATKQSVIKTAPADKDTAKHDDEDSITDEVEDLRTAGSVKKSSEWSDEEEAGGLPRSESRASRVSRAVRQLLCCGMSYEAPSEDNVDNEKVDEELTKEEQDAIGTIEQIHKLDEYPIAVSEEKNNMVPTLEVEEGIQFIRTASPSNSEEDDTDQALKEVEGSDSRGTGTFDEPMTAFGQEKNIHFLSLTNEGGEVFQLNQMIKSSPNMCNAPKKKGITWEDNEYLERIPLQEMSVRSQPWMSVERKASVGPCFKSGMPFSGPSGIMLSLPRKPMKTVADSLKSMPSGINITVSKKNIADRPKSRVSGQQTNHKSLERVMERSTKRVEESYVKFVGMLRGKLDNVRGKIKNVINL